MHGRNPEKSCVLRKRRESIHGQIDVVQLNWHRVFSRNCCCPCELFGSRGIHRSPVSGCRVAAHCIAAIVPRASVPYSLLNQIMWSDEPISITNALLVAMAG
jgi:hypothetical protein